jgi:hypothetical protein
MTNHPAHGEQMARPNAVLHYLLITGINPLNAKLNSICHLPALLGAHHILHFRRIRFKHTHTALNDKEHIQFKFTAILWLNSL